MIDGGVDAGSQAFGSMGVPGSIIRTCGTCTLCCRLPEIDEFSKPANAWCSNCTGSGCAIYEARPTLCRDFHCSWVSGAKLGNLWAPLHSHMMIYEQGPQITVLVDPDFPAIWKQEPYFSDMKRWAAEGAEAGRYVIVFVGDDVFKVE